MIKRLSQLFRLIHINLVLVRHGLDNVVLSIRLFAPLRFLTYLNPWNWFRQQEFNRGRAIRESLEELGPIFVKFGQALSTRADLLPVDIIQELAKLQDKVPPFDGAIAKKIIEREFGKPLSELFLEFSVTPLASASIAQVHAATLLSGEEIVVKILRPNIMKVIKRDLSLLYTLASLTETYWESGKKLKVRRVVEEFEITLLDELDLMREASNASQLRRNFLNSDILYIPQIHWDYTREKVMAMERIHGIPIADREQLEQAGVNLKILAQRGIEIFFIQVFRDCFFHADMHPGNIFVSYKNPQNPQYICVDFGIIGTLSDDDKHYLAENLYAFFNRDYRRVAQLHVESGWVPRQTRVAEFEGAIRAVCEPIFERPLKDISLGQLVLRLFQTGRRFHMEVQPQLILLQKTLLAIEGLGRQLYPDLDLWSTAKPFIERWVKQQVGFTAVFENMKNQMPFFTEQLPLLPKLVYDLLKQTKELQYEQQTTQNLLTEKQHTRKQSFWRGLGVGLAVMSFSALLINYSASLHNIIFETLSAVGIIGLLIILLANPR